MRKGHATSAVQTALLLAACVAAHGELAPGYVEVDDIHADIALPFIGAGLSGAWQPFVHTGNLDYVGNYAPNAAACMVNESTRERRPAGAQFDFIGVPAGAPIWRISPSPVPGQLYLGFQADHGFSSGRMEASNATNWKSWDPDGPGPAVTARYVMFNIVAVRGPGLLSIWDADTFGSIQVRVDSTDGFDAFDGLPQLIRSHSHYHIAFTAPGYYEVDFRGRTILGPDSGTGTPIESPIVTFHFLVGPRPALRILREGADVVLAWPDPSPGWMLESSPELAPADWTPVLTPPAVLGGERRLTWGAPVGRHFFRLRRP